MIRLGIDAGNLSRDRRGMGRLTRGVLRAASADARFACTLLFERRSDARALREEFPASDLMHANRARAKRAFDLVWYPWNGMRWPSAAPAVVTMCDAFAFTEPHPDALARHREQRPIRDAAKRAAVVATISQWSRSEIERELRVPSDRIVVIAPTPDPFFFPALGDELPPELAGKRIVLLVGAREKRKNARLAIEACARAFEDERDVLVVAGKLSDADRTLARRLGVAAGEIAPSDATLRALYRNCALVVVPSNAEGFGLVAIEALACAALVLASDASALPEATQGAALLLPPGDVDHWAGAIAAFLRDPDKGTPFRIRAASTFAFSDRNGYARAMLELFARTAAPARTSSS